MHYLLSTPVLLVATYGRDTLASSGSCRRWTATAFRREIGLLASLRVARGLSASARARIASSS